MSWLLISSGEVLVLLLIPLMTSYKCPLTWTSEKQLCSLELLCPSRWFSLWFLPDLLYLDTYLSSIWSRDAFLNLGLRSCDTNILLKTIEVLSFVIFFQRCHLPHDSLIIMFQFCVSSSLCLTSFFHNVLWFAPDFFLWIYLSHLDLPISLLPLWNKVRRRGSWHSPLACLHSLGCLFETEEWGRVQCSWLRAKVLDSESIWSLPWWAPTLDCCSLCCSADVFAVMVRSLGFSCLNDWFKSDNFWLTVLEQPLSFLFLSLSVLLVAFSNMGKL